MRIIRNWLILAALATSMQIARAQLIDPTTGIEVDAASDPMDFSAVASGQPGNIGTEVAAQAMAQAQAASDAAMAATQAAMDQANANTSDDSEPAPPQPPPVPVTPKPTVTPKGGTFNLAKGTHITVKLADQHTGAVLYYTTGANKAISTWTPYKHPIHITADTTLKAVAIASGQQPSPIVTEKFKIKS